MAVDLSVDFCGIKSPNPFWLASAPPSNSGYQVMRAFEAGWGGAVWKTIGEPIVNTSSRYSAVDLEDRRVMGLNNIELISDRPIEDNLREIREVKRHFPHHAVIASLMVESKRETWHDIVKRAEDAGADGHELNFGCPHGMSERGMGAAVGQVPDYTCQITEWAVEAATRPVIVKLTPNITDVRFPGRAAKRGGAHALSLINTINSITGIDLSRSSRAPSSVTRRATAATAARRLSPSRSTWSRRSPTTLRFACPSAASAALRRGATPSSSCCSARQRCRSAPPSCTAASASSRT
jgi:dihydropyrimidine dehydrogenase (NAD+) subunit PreA